MGPWLYTVSGLVVGCIVGMTGVGGGSLMTPLLVLLFGVAPATAVGTDLLYASATKTAGSVVHGRSRTVNWRVVALLMAGSIPAAILSMVVLRWFAVPDRHAGLLISRLLGICLLLTAVTILLRPWILRLAASGRTEFSAPVQAGLTVAMGAVLGVLVTCSSIGAGAIGVTALILLYPRTPIPTIVGTDIAHAVPLTLVAGLGHAASGSVNWTVLACLLLGSIPGIIGGSLLATRIDERILRVLLATVLIVVGGRLAIV